MFHRNTGEIVNGIEFTRRNRITLTNKILISTQLKLLQYMLVIAGVYGTLFSFITGLNIPVYKNSLFAAIFISALYFFVLYLYQPIIKVSLPLSCLLYMAAGYVFWDEIINGFWHIENIYISKYNSYYNTGILKYLVKEYDQKAVITIFFIFTAILLSFLICAVILRNSLRTLFAIITVFLVLLPFTVGLTPAPLSFGIYLACVISIIGIGTTMKEKHRHFNLKHLHGKHKIEDRLLEQNFKYVIGLKIGGFLAALLLALFLFTSIIITPDLYASKFNVVDTKNKIQKEMMEFNLEEAIQNISTIQLDGLDLFQGIKASGGLSGGKLGRIGEVNFNYSTALRIQTTVTGSNLYLKGYAGSNYKGNYWDGLSKEDTRAYKKIAAMWKDTDFTIGNQSSYFLSLINKVPVTDSYKSFVFFYNDMEIEAVKANSNYIYAPYYTLYEPEELVDTADPEYVSPKQRQISYHFNYYDSFNNILEFNEEEEFNDFITESGVFLNDVTNESRSVAAELAKLDEYRVFEKSYRKFVYDIYTRMPETGLEQLREDYGSIQYSNYKEKYGTKALSLLVDLVRKDLKSAATYSLSPGALPRGKDFVEYFLYVNKTGYCTHFASAATMIFRTMGIPARYVEGYIVKPNDIASGQTLGTQVLTERINGVDGEHQRIKKSIEITDANAHAWVEIYLDGFGWVPVEVTPGFNRNGIFIEDADVQPEQTEKSENQQIPEVIPSPSPTQEAEQETKAEDKPSDSKEEEEAKTSEQEKEALESKGEASGTGTDGTDGETNPIFSSYLIKIAWVILWGLIIIASVIFFLALRAFVLLHQREKQQKASDFSRRVLLRYNEINRILDYYSINRQEDMTYQEAADRVEEQWDVISPGSYRRFADIALKAKFNQYCITRDESEEAEKFYKEMIDLIYKNNSPSKRLILRFIKVFH